MKVAVYRGNAMPAMCDNCPFQTNGKAVELHPERLRDIQQAVVAGQPFYCHKTVYAKPTEWEDPNEEGTEKPVRGAHWRECAGSLDYKEAFIEREGMAGVVRVTGEWLESVIAEAKARCAQETDEGEGT